MKAPYAASLAMKPSSSGTPAIDAALVTAATLVGTPSHAQRGKQADVARAVWWSTMPTTMNAIALNRAWARSRRMPGLRRRWRPGAEQHDEEAELAHRAEGEEQLEVVLAQCAAVRRRAS